MEVWILVLGLCFEFFPPVNKATSGSGVHLDGIASLLPRGHAGGDVAGERLVSSGGPCAGVPMPGPWRGLGPSGFAPTSLSRFSCWNKSLHGGAQEESASSRFPRFLLATMVVERMVEKEEKIVLLGRAFCMRPHCWLSALEATMAVDKESGGSSELMPAVSGWSSPAMESKVELRRLRWQPVLTTQPLLLLAEGRPTLFLPDGCHMGGSFSFYLEAMACRCCCYGGLLVPSGSSPATARLNLGGSCFGSDCVSISQFGVLLAKVMDLCVIFCFSWVLM